MSDDKLRNPFREVFDRMLGTFAEHQWEALCRSYVLAMRPERKARLRAIMELSVELDRIKKVSIFGTGFHEQIIEEIIQGDWKQAAETNRLMLDPESATDHQPGWEEHNERYRKLWEGFRAIVMMACAEAAKRASGEMGEPD